VTTDLDAWLARALEQQAAIRLRATVEALLTVVIRAGLATEEEVRAAIAQRETALYQRGR